MKKAWKNSQQKKPKRYNIKYFLTIHFWPKILKRVQIS